MRGIAATMLASGLARGLAEPAPADQIGLHWEPRSFEEALVFELGLTALGLRDGVDLRQRGRDNRAEVRQGREARALIRQRGRDHAARVDQRRGGSRVLLQLGRGSRATLGGGSGVTMLLGF